MWWTEESQYRLVFLSSPFHLRIWSPQHPPIIQLLSVSSLILKECELVVAYRNVLNGCSTNPRFWSSTLGPCKSSGNPKWRNSQGFLPIPVPTPYLTLSRKFNSYGLYESVSCSVVSNSLQPHGL